VTKVVKVRLTKPEREKLFSRLERVMRQAIADGTLDIRVDAHSEAAAKQKVDAWITRSVNAVIAEFAP
jgi:hypothetical protein